MAEQSREYYQLTGSQSFADIERQINYILNRISDRLDQMEGLRGTPTFYKNLLAFFDGNLTSGQVLKATSATEAEIGTLTSGMISGGFEAATILTLASGVLTLVSSSAWRRNIVAAETGTSDSLTSISGGSVGDVIILSPDTGDTITVVAGASLIMTPTFIMDSADDMIMLECKSAGVWREITRKSNG